MNLWHYIGAALMFLLITFAGILSGRNVKSSAAFSGSDHRAGLGVVTGTIAGTLVGGASTVGTAQLAFTYGFSAWWFTLGGAIGCLIMALFYAKPLHDKQAITMPQILSEEFGRKAALVAAIMSSAGSFLGIVSQLLSGMALISSVSSISALWSSLLIAGLMLFYVFFGGVWGVGIVGIVKTVILWVGIGFCGLIAISAGGGISSFTAAFPKEQYFNLFARGLSADLGAGLSLVVGIITTQTYVQAVLSAKSARIARKGAVLSAIFIPVIGAAGIFVGMYMKLTHPDIAPATALPLFILEKTPPILAGVLLAALLVALVGTGAGLCLGISSMFCRDLYKPYLRPSANDKEQLRFTRIAIVIVLFIAGAMSIGNMGSMILGWSFLSLGLRSAVAFFPLNAALFCKGKIPSGYVMAAMFLAPVTSIFSKLFITGIDPLFPGMAISFLILFVGWFHRKKCFSH